MSSTRARTALGRVAQVRIEIERLETERVTLIARALHHGSTWAEIATALNVSPQAAHRRYRHAKYDPTSRKAWLEPTLPLT